MNHSRTTFLIALVFSLSLAAAAQAEVSLVLTAGKLQDAAGAVLKDGTTLLLVADANHDGHADLDTACELYVRNTTGTCDVIVARCPLKRETTGVAGSHETLVRFDLERSGLWPGDELLLVWLDTTATARGTVTKYGSYRTADWRVPADGATISLELVTQSAGGTVPDKLAHADQLLAGE